VFARIHARDHAGTIDSGHCRENRVVVGESHASCGERRKIGHQSGINLGRLESVEYKD